MCLPGSRRDGGGWRGRPDSRSSPGWDGSGVSPPRAVRDTAHVIDLRGDGTGGVWVMFSFFENDHQMHLHAHQNTGSYQKKSL